MPRDIPSHTPPSEIPTEPPKEKPIIQPEITDKEVIRAANISPSAMDAEIGEIEKEVNSPSPTKVALEGPEYDVPFESLGEPEPPKKL